MGNFRLGKVGLSVAAAFVFISAIPRSSRADVTIFEKDAWSVWTSGRSAAHYQFIAGGGNPAPSAPGVVLVGFGSDAAANGNNDVATSRIRSGWVGAQLGFGVANQLTPSVKLKTFFALNIADITNNRQKTDGKAVDFREAFSAAEGPWGTVIFGRALSIFGTALAGPTYMWSYGNGVGHPCTVDGQAITCGPVNAGVIFPGFNAQAQYISPRFGGAGFKFAVVDPSLPSVDIAGVQTYPYSLRPVPRAEAEATYELLLGASGKLMFQGQGLWQTMGRPSPVMPTSTQYANALGGILGGRIEVAGFRLGTGVWGGKGLGTGVPMQPNQAVDPVGNLRMFSGFMAAGNYMFGDTEIGAGFGRSNVSQTADDAATPLRSLIKSNTAFHVVAYHHIGGLVLGAEFMHWISEWHRGETQRLNFMGVGANFLW
jgi:predicted porin